ncbi:MAG TPA: PQQ-dependent sugar dehydrogenase [Saprospiraceae bacterium]|nr:PQQ-dependent sugar dehydrogenase [Saprospiraceae bacterium]
MIARFFKLTFLFLPFLAEAQNKIELTPVMNGLSIPVDIVFDYNNRMYVVEKTGKIKTGDISQQTVYLDIDDRVNSGANERGLLGMAFHPDYQANGYVFVNYTGGNGQTVVSRFTRSANDSLKADADSEKILMTIAQPFNNHNAGDLNFGPDGYLYIAMGDGGSGGDPGNRSQNPKERLGKMLRIDVNTEATHYLIPDDNPYAGNPDTLGEIWSMGLRNPWRFSFDRATNDLWIADVGQRKWEEINHIPYGLGPKLNFGWRCYEGFEKYDFSLCNSATEFYPPIHVYANNSGADGCSVTGGFVYRGQQNPYLYGQYVYGDFCSGKIWRLKRDECGAVKNEHIHTVGPQELSSFGEDNFGELYLAMLGEGRVYKITPACLLSVSIDSLSPASCMAASDGAVNYTVSGASAYTFELSNNSNPSALSPGNYSYKVTETGSGCIQTGCFDIGIDTVPQFCFSPIVDTFCWYQKYFLDTSICDLTGIDSVQLYFEDKLFYTGSSLPDSLEMGGIYHLLLHSGNCIYEVDSFLVLDQIFIVGNGLYWTTLTDSVVIVKGDSYDYDYYEMYFQDSLWAVSNTGLFDLPKEVFGTYYFIGYTTVGPCPTSARSANLVISAIHETNMLEHPWYFPNPASYQIETKEFGIDKVNLLDALGKTIYTWVQPTPTLNLPVIADGMYLLKIERNKHIYYQKLMLSKK